MFYDGKTYNGHSAGRIDSGGVHVLGIEHTRDKMVGRGVLLDIARYKGVDWLEDGYGISNAELDATAEKQGVRIEAGVAEGSSAQSGNIRKNGFSIALGSAMTSAPCPR